MFFILFILSIALLLYLYVAKMLELYISNQNLVSKDHTGHIHMALPIFLLLRWPGDDRKMECYIGDLGFEKRR